MKFKDYLNSLVSRRKSHTSSSKSHHQVINKKNPQELTTSADCHYDICGYEDINNLVTDDQHSRTQILLARHAELVNTIVETRSSQDNPLSSCTQCRVSHQSSPMIPPPPPLPPPLPPKLSLDQQISLSNRNYSSTLATCSPRRECQHHPKQPPQHQQLYYQTPLISSQYSTPNPSVNSSSSSSLWTTTASLSKKQRSRIRTNPWIGKTSTNNRSSTFIESSSISSNHQTSPDPSISHPEYSIYDPTYRTPSSALIHSESFPQTTSNGNIHLLNPPSPPPASVPPPTASVILHQSDSGHGFSLASSRVINTSSSSPSSTSSPPSISSSPDDTSGDGIVSNDKQLNRQKKFKKKTSSTSPILRKRSPKRNINIEQNFCSNTISSDSGSLTRRTKTHQIPSLTNSQYRYQRSSGGKKTSPIKSSIDRIHHKQQSHSSSSQSIDDHFSLEFEEILENERSFKQRKDKQCSTKLLSPIKSPFILPLDETNVKLSSPPPPPPPPPQLPPSILFSSTLTKTNSRAILKHIEEIENEIRLIKNLDLANGVNDDDEEEEEEYVFSPHAYPEEDIDLEDDTNNDTEEVEIKDERQSIYDQVDQWVEKCLTTTNSTENPATLLHTECDHLSNTIKDYVVCVCPNDDQQTSSIPPPPPTTKLMTAFYLSSIPMRTTKRTASFIAEPLKLEECQTVNQHLKSIHECPF